MYNEYNYKENELMVYENNQAEMIDISKHKKKVPFLKRLFSLILCAVLFGTVAGGTFYGVGQLYEKNVLNTEIENSDSTEQSQNGTPAISLTYSSNTAAFGGTLNVESVATNGLKSVVAVTNISVTEVNNYFNRFGPHGYRNNQPQTIETSSCGSGVIFSQSNGYLYMLTNYHVVEGATTLSVTFADDKTYEATLCGYDEDVDIAVVKVAVNNLSEDTLSEIAIIGIADSDLLNVGQQVVAIGNALGYGQSVTTGIVSALNRYIDNDTSVSYIQTDAAINPGNSGGALLDMNGNLIGINTVKVSSTEVEGMCYAIPISDILDLVNDMII